MYVLNMYDDVPAKICKLQILFMYLFCSTIYQTCVSHLLDVSLPALDTVKMQVHFDMNYSSRSKFVEFLRFGF